MGLLVVSLVGWALAGWLARELQRMTRSRDAVDERVALQQRLIAALKTANAEKDLAITMIVRAVDEDLAERSFSWMPADTRADAKYRSIH